MNKSSLIISVEAISGKSEDAQLLINRQAATIGVFDGLGGKPAGFGGERGGRIASREASIITKAILQETAGELSEKDVSRIQHEICKHLRQEADTKIKSRVTGSLTHRLCTTLALANISNASKTEGFRQLSLAWIGDSRIYLLSPQKGLQQLTKDDLKVSNDAFRLIHEDSPMSKHLTADMPLDWQINFKIQIIKGKGFVIACTDGCFQCLDSPWAFEKLLLDTLVKSNSVREWEIFLTQRYEEIKQDDVSLVLYPLGFDFDDFQFIQSSYHSRLNQLNENFSLVSGAYDELLDLWSSYRLNYEEMLIPGQADNNLNEPDTENDEVSISEEIKLDEYQEKLPISAYTEKQPGILEERGDETSLLERSKGNALNLSHLLTKNENNYASLDEESDLSLPIKDTEFNNTTNDSVLTRQNILIKCPDCQSEKNRKTGHTSSLSREQRYQCKSCNRYFQESTKFQTS